MVVESQLTMNTKKLFKDISKLTSKYPETSKRVALEYANESQKESVQGIIPVVTGNLRSTSRVSQESKSVKFVTGGMQGTGKPSVFVNYAKFVNNGSSRQNPQFFMERSVNKASSKFNSFTKKILDSWLAYAFKK